ncbi:hypothetical protein Dimus_000017 [Dionaea muscipula]
MLGQVSHELEMNVPPSKAWEVYGSLQLAKLCEAKLPHIERVTIVQGDGGVGTILQLTYAAPAAAGGQGQGQGSLMFYKEKFTKIDNEKRVKETEAIEGGYLDLGFTFYRVRLQVIAKEGEGEGEANSCIVKSTIEYHVKDEFAHNASLVTIQPLEQLAQLVADHLTIT